VGSVPFGYRNVRKDGRRVVEVDPIDSPKVKRIYDFYAYRGCTLDSLQQRLADEGIVYTDSTPRFQRSQLHRVLSNRSYVGQVAYQGEWYPGSHEPLITLETFDRVQELLGGHIYRAHQMTYASELISCGHYGHPITGELKTKKTPFGEYRGYTYYRCGRYNAVGHPRVRMTEAQLDAQVMALFDRLRLKDEAVRQWFVDVIRARFAHAQAANVERLNELERQRSIVKGKQDRLLDLRLNSEVTSEAYATKNAELGDQAAHLRMQIESCDRNGEDTAAFAIKAFELSQNLKVKWLSADYAEKRTILEIVCLNFRLDGITLVPAIRKPFDLLAEGLVLEDIGSDGI
jgi:site-specific DNA recombinase